MAMLDSIIKTSDTVYTKKYRSQEFATATYFVNKKDSVVYQIMKDVNEVIRQVIGSKNNTLLYKAAYFANGQLMQDLKVNALFRRLNNEEPDVVKFGDLIIDRERYLIKLKEEEIILARKEFELLDLLASKPGKVFLRNDILNQVWGTEVIVGDRTIDVHIRKIRQKLNLNCITTVKGVGYKFEMQ